MCVPHEYVHRCIYMCLPMHTHPEIHIHVCPMHVQTGAHIYAPHAHTYTGGIYVCIPCMYVYTHFPGLRTGVYMGTHIVQGSVHTLVFHARFSALCLWILPLAHVSPGYRPLTLLGEFCLCSRRQQGCAATGTPLLWGRPQTGALPPCPCTCVTPPQNELLLPPWLQLTNLGGLSEGGSGLLLPLFGSVELVW